MRHGRCKGLSQQPGLFLQLHSAGHPGQPEQVSQGNRIAGGNGAVLKIFLADEQLLAVIRGLEETAGFIVPEMGQRYIGERQCFLQIFADKACLIELKKTPDQENVVIEHTGYGSLSCPVSM